MPTASGRPSARERPTSAYQIEGAVAADGRAPPRAARTATRTAGGSTRCTAAATRPIGLNYYFRQVVTADPAGSAPRAAQVSSPDWTLTDMGWEVYADGLEQLPLRLTEKSARAASTSPRTAPPGPTPSPPTARSRTRTAWPTSRSTWRP
ncbi:hypothetical protein GCM10009682_16320 [Luedemannella flava]|uniref:Uncharacterized protein n=1 Tax=Luedemannella flava TaxID=349316 RepID=A0ABP4XUK2_9ACTN